MNPLIIIPLAYFMMLITNNLYFFQFNWNFIDRHRSNEVVPYDYFWIGVYQLFRGLYYFTLLGLNIWYCSTIPNVFFFLFLSEFFRHLIRKSWWFFIVNLSTLIYLFYYIYSNIPK